MFSKKPPFSIGQIVYWSEIHDSKVGDMEFKGEIKKGSIISCDKNKASVFCNNNIIFKDIDKLYNQLYKVKNILGIMLSGKEMLECEIDSF